MSYRNEALDELLSIKLVIVKVENKVGLNQMLIKQQCFTYLKLARVLNVE